MTKKKSEDGSSAEMTKVSLRMHLYSEKLWGGNQSRMAEDLGVSKAAMSRLLLGQQMPTFTVIEALAKRSDVNIRWFLTGEGEPFHDVGSGLGVGRFRPIAEELLPGSPGEHRGLLSGMGYPVAEAFHSETSYWYRPPLGSEWTHSAGGATGDLLLMETDPRWTRSPAAMPGNLCGVRYRTGRRSQIALARIGGVPEKTPFYGSDEAGDSSDQSVEVFGVKIYLRHDDERPVVEDVKFVAPAFGGETPKAPRGADATRLTVEDVACVCVKIDRPGKTLRWRD